MTQKRYEFRVWGRNRKARKILAQLASDEKREQVEDCYLLVDDPSWNAKIRGNRLKIKQLKSERKGFERWSSGYHRSSDSVPSPFDTIFEDLRLDRPLRGKPYDLAKAIRKLGPNRSFKPVFLTKERRLYQIGELQAEVTDIIIDETGDVLQTLSIEGDDLDELVALRKKLQLRDKPKIAVHQAVEEEVA